MSKAKLKTLLDIFAAIAGLVGLATVFIVEDRFKSWLALLTLIAFLAYIAWRITRALNAMTNQKYPGGYLKLATFIRYTNIDGKTLEYETIKIIQSKFIVPLNSVEHEFRWSGTLKPTITSSLHQIVSIIEGKAAGKYDKAVIELNDALMYNQVGIVPIKMTVDDSDKASQTYSSVKIEHPSHLISWRVELGSIIDRSSKPARLMQRKISSEMAAEWELIKSVPYHHVHKCYEDMLLYPKTGYFYRLEWER